MAGIYIHIPFCVRKCLYCDFVSGEGTVKDMEMYVDSLVNRLKRDILESSSYRNVNVLSRGH